MGYNFCGDIISTYLKNKYWIILIKVAYVTDRLYAYRYLSLCQKDRLNSKFVKLFKKTTIEIKRTKLIHSKLFSEIGVEYFLGFVGMTKTRSDLKYCFKDVLTNKVASTNTGGAGSSTRSTTPRYHLALCCAAAVSVETRTATAT